MIGKLFVCRRQNNVYMKYIFLIAGSVFLLSSCVAKRYLVQSQSHVAQLQADSTSLQNKVYDLQGQISKLESNMADLNKQISELSSRNTELGQMTAEQKNLLNQSQQDLADKQQRLQQLENLLAQQKAASVELKNRMSEALTGYSSSELSVVQKNGKVYVSLSENLLFPSGSAVVNKSGVDALSKLAAVLNLNPDVSIQIEGNTDSIPIKGRYQDNWELSTARANAIVRILTDRYNVDPTKVVSVGHSYHDPVDTNTTPEGRARNRRTDIVLSPNLEEMYKLLDRY